MLIKVLIFQEELGDIGEDLGLGGAPATAAVDEDIAAAAANNDDEVSFTFICTVI